MGWNPAIAIEFCYWLRGWPMTFWRQLSSPTDPVSATLAIKVASVSQEEGISAEPEAAVLWPQLCDRSSATLMYDRQGHLTLISLNVVHVVPVDSFTIQIFNVRFLKMGSQNCGHRTAACGHRTAASGSAEIHYCLSATRVGWIERRARDRDGRHWRETRGREVLHFKWPLCSERVRAAVRVAHFLPC